MMDLWYPVRLSRTGYGAERLTEEPVTKKEALAILRAEVKRWRAARERTASIDYEEDENGNLDRTRPQWLLRDTSYSRAGGSAYRATLYLVPAENNDNTGHSSTMSWPLDHDLRVEHNKQ